ncbi:hypothetical protein EIP91_012379 [Steccherinum ochraceum]|uniref:Tim44-like domain-containing protein n=1 Tax=Steccherinum ochraceum TaxID=92696 RepID=A0A4V2MWS8_9APHY|nr:hypothetical protein EIP91_012379 [Steccherinum ochraceum]
MAQTMKEREEGNVSNAQMLKEVELVTAVEQYASFDVWAKPLENLDLYIPAWSDSRKDASMMDHLRTAWNTQTNWFKNMISMYRIAKQDGFPDVSVRSALSPQVFRVQTTPWLAPFCQTAMGTYMELQKAIALGDEKTIKKLSIGAHHKRLIDLVRARDPAKIYAWSSDAPAQNNAKVVSIRAFEQNMSREPPKYGNRLTVQALVRFDTLQKLDVYSKHGRPLLSPEPKRVVEYLIFQKRMWYDVPWVVRDQLYEGLQGTVKHL